MNNMDKSDSCDDVVEKIHCETAKEFLETLRITNDLWLPPDVRESPWIFRGQMDASWDLVPCAWRRSKTGEDEFQTEVLLRRFSEQVGSDAIKDTILNWHSQYTQNGRDVSTEFVSTDYIRHVNENPHLQAVLLQTALEIDLVRLFVEFVDRLGYSVPGSGTPRFDTGHLLDWKYMIGGSVGMLLRTDWHGDPSRPIWAAKDQAPVALAQHHGIPTSLLDWTHKPLIAAFFAAEGAASSQKQTASRMSVWALHTEVVGSLNENTKRLKIPPLRRSELSYFHVQDGVLTYDIGGDYHFINHGCWPTIQQAVANASDFLDCFPLRKVTLPISEARELLRLLWAEGVSRPHLMPTIDNIGRAVTEYWY